MGEGEAGGRAPEGKVGGGIHEVDRQELDVVRAQQLLQPCQGGAIRLGVLTYQFCRLVSLPADNNHCECVRERENERVYACSCVCKCVCV